MLLLTVHKRKIIIDTYKQKALCGGAGGNCPTNFYKFLYEMVKIKTIVIINLSVASRSEPSIRERGHVARAPNP